MINMTHKDIIDAWALIRKTNHTIPDDVLDFMKNAAIDQLSEEEDNDCFKVTIDDGYCAWQFRFKPKNQDELSIGNIIAHLNEHFESPTDRGKLIESTNMVEAKALCELLKNTAEEVADTMKNAENEKEAFAIGFLKYVEETYTRKEDQYYFKHHNKHVHRNIIEVMENYKYFLKQHEEQGTQA